MSGGSMDYTCYKIEEYADMLEDKELIDLAKDFAVLYKAAEWYHSSDIARGEYQEAINKFKEKWFNEPRDKRLKEYIELTANNYKAEMLRMIGEYNRCADCIHSSSCEYDKYVSCDIYDKCLHHKEDCCEKFE